MYSLIFLLFCLNILYFILLIFWAFFSSDKFESIHFFFLVIFILADEDHDLTGWEVTNQLFLCNLKDKLDQIITLLLHELRYFVPDNTSYQVHLPHNLPVG